MTFEEVCRKLTDRTLLLGYPDGLTALKDWPLGYGFMYALSGIDSEMVEGGLRALRRSHSWRVTLPTIEYAEVLGYPRLARVLKEMIFYYHRLGTSGMKKRLPPRFFSDIPAEWSKSIQDLEDEFHGAKPLLQYVVVQRPELFEQAREDS